MTCGLSFLPCHSMISICTLVIYLCILNGLELHWVQGGPIVTLARLFLFLFTPHSNWPNTWPMKICPKHGRRKWPKHKPKIKHILLCIMFIKLAKKWKSKQQLILPEIRVFWDPFLLPIFLAKYFEAGWVFITQSCKIHFISTSPEFIGKFEKK